MRRYLVVANQTLGGEHLADEVRRRMAAGPCRFHIVVPATQPKDHPIWTEGEARTLARERLDRAQARLRELGAEADGEVGDERPLDAIRDAVSAREFDEVILSTLPAGISRWLGQDLVHKVERALDLPVTHIIGESEPAPPGP